MNVTKISELEDGEVKERKDGGMKGRKEGKVWEKNECWRDER